MEMDEKKNVEKNEAPDQRPGVLKLTTPYLFEGVEYSEIDLNGLEKLTVQDAVDAQRELFNEREVAASTLCETTTAFARKLACKATGLPIEFFMMAPRRVSRQIMLSVRAYLNADANTTNHVMKLEKPYSFKGKEYTEIDLTGVADLHSLNESEAANRIVREGFMVTETSFNYLYACVLASMATGLPEEFFMGLPLVEALKIKNAVNDAGFFEYE